MIVLVCRNGRTAVMQPQLEQVIAWYLWFEPLGSNSPRVNMQLPHFEQVGNDITYFPSISLSSSGRAVPCHQGPFQGRLASEFHPRQTTTGVQAPTSYLGDASKLLSRDHLLRGNPPAHSGGRGSVAQAGGEVNRRRVA